MKKFSVPEILSSSKVVPDLSDSPSCCSFLSLLSSVILPPKQCSRTCGGGKQNRTFMCLSDPVHRRPVNEKYCHSLRHEQLVRGCNEDVNCAEWAYGEESPVSLFFRKFSLFSIFRPQICFKIH